jgi:hypothetical protein
MGRKRKMRSANKVLVENVKEIHIDEKIILK